MSGSAATIPSWVSRPDAVVPPTVYAVAVNVCAGPRGALGASAGDGDGPGSAPDSEHLAEAAEEPEAEESGEVDEDTEFEEEELEQEPAFAEEQQEEAIGQAEARTSGQRTERPHFDRRNRGRRGGGQHGRMMRRREAPRQQIPISELLKEGQEVLVQIAKEPIGKKGARITSHIALPGRFLVYMPTITHIGVSRKITSEEERHRLKRIMISEREGGHGGFIVRTAAAGVGEDELRADIRFLKNLWAQIKQRSESSKAPALIYHDLNLVERILRDQVTSDFTQVWVDNEAEYERILNFANRFQPGLVRRVKLYTKDTPLYEQFGIQEEINKAMKAKVWLKSGGYIVINQTEALVAIDINTGKYVGKTARLEDTIVKTNIDATKEIVRQIRLRDLGGIIVVDFIDMDERRNRQKVMQALEEALKADRSPSKVLAFNDFGLVAITRKRVKQSLERTLGAPCPYCTGNGYVKSITTVCNEIYVELRKMAPHFETDIVNLRVNPEIAKALKAEKGKWLQDFEEISRRPVLVKPDPLLHQEQFDIEA
jgi:ribonuclease G